MTRTYLLAVTVAATLAAGIAGLDLLPVGAKPMSYDLPEETAALKPGPDVEVVQGNCMGCHSVDYITTQPRGPRFGEGVLASGSDEDDQGVRRAHRRTRRRQDRRLSRRDVLGRVLINAQIGVRFRGQTGKHMLVLRFTAFDPGCVKTRCWI